MADFEIFETLLKNENVKRERCGIFGQFLKYWDREESIITDEQINTFDNCREINFDKLR